MIAAQPSCRILCLAGLIASALSSWTLRRSASPPTSELASVEMVALVYCTTDPPYSACGDLRDNVAARSQGWVDDRDGLVYARIGPTCTGVELELEVSASGDLAVIRLDSTAEDPC